MHTETTHSSDYWLGTVLLLYLHRPATDRVAGIVTTPDTGMTTVNYTVTNALKDMTYGPCRAKQSKQSKHEVCFA